MGEISAWGHPLSFQSEMCLQRSGHKIQGQNGRRNLAEGEAESSSSYSHGRADLLLIKKCLKKEREENIRWTTGAYWRLGTNLTPNCRRGEPCCPVWPPHWGREEQSGDWQPRLRERPRSVWACLTPCWLKCFHYPSPEASTQAGTERWPASLVFEGLPRRRQPSSPTALPVCCWQWPSSRASTSWLHGPHRLLQPLTISDFPTNPVGGF